METYIHIDPLLVENGSYISNYILHKYYIYRLMFT